MQPSPVSPHTLTPSDDKPVYLFIDLDGTLVAQDMTWESLIVTCHQRSGLMQVLRLALSRNKCELKAYCAKRMIENNALQPKRLNYIDPLVQWVQQYPHAHRVLATASHHHIAQKMVDDLGFWDGWIGSDATHNYGGKHKLKAIHDYLKTQQACDAYWIYAGNAWIDFDVWRGSPGVAVVYPHASFLRKLKYMGRVVFSTPKPQCSIQQYIHMLHLEIWIASCLYWFYAPFDTWPIFIGWCVGRIGGLYLDETWQVVEQRNRLPKAQSPVSRGSISIPRMIVLGLCGLGIGSVLTQGLVLGLYALSCMLASVTFVNRLMQAALWSVPLFLGAYASRTGVDFLLSLLVLWVGLSIACAQVIQQDHQIDTSWCKEQELVKNRHPAPEYYLLPVFSSLAWVCGILMMMRSSDILIEHSIGVSLFWLVILILWGRYIVALYQSYIHWTYWIKDPVCLISYLILWSLPL